MEEVYDSYRTAYMSGSVDKEIKNLFRMISYISNSQVE